MNYAKRLCGLSLTIYINIYIGSTDPTLTGGGKGVEEGEGRRTKSHVVFHQPSSQQRRSDLIQMRSAPMTIPIHLLMLIDNQYMEFGGGGWIIKMIDRHCVTVYSTMFVYIWVCFWFHKQLYMQIYMECRSNRGYSHVYSLIFSSHLFISIFTFFSFGI